MANTGYQISPTLRQYFTSGPNSGSVVSSSFDINLAAQPFSASVNATDFFYRSYNSENCEPGFEDCLVPLLTSLNTGSQRGRFEINYVTQSGFNTASRITSSVSNDINFSTSEIFSASIGNIMPVTTSFTSGTIYFKAFTSCSGPTPSPDSDPLSFTYDLLPPPLNAGSVNIIFKNSITSTMEVLIRSTRGNSNYIISAGDSVTYDYSTSPNPGAWTATGRSEDLNITIKGGSKNDYGNFLQKTISGIEKETYITEGGFNNADSSNDDSSTFNPDTGVSFKIRQLSLPINGTITTTTLTLLQNIPPTPVPVPQPEPDPGPQPYFAPQPYVELVFGSTPISSQNSACDSSNVNYREKTYYQRNGYLYNTRANALDNIKPTFEFQNNFILTNASSYIIVNKDGYIQNRGGCILPTVDIYTIRGSFDTQEAACKRKKLSGTSFSYKDNQLINSNLSGRYPLYSGVNERGGTNIILSSGKIIGYETCGSELTTVQFGSIGFLNAIYPLETPNIINPRTFKWICSNELKNYSLGPSGILYYDVNSQYAYVPVGLGNRWYKTTEGDFVNFDKGEIINRTNPC